MQAITQFEGAILLFIQEFLRIDALNGAMCFITHLGDKGMIWIVMTLILLIIRRTRRIGLACAAAMVLNLIATNIALKNIIQRIRPYDVMDSLKILVEAQHDFSFPSGHTACSFAAAWVMYRMLPRKWGVSALVLAALISLSRLYVGVHYPTDVLGGAIIGLCSAMLTLAVMPRLDRKFRFLKKFYRYPAKAKKRSKARRA